MYVGREAGIGAVALVCACAVAGCAEGAAPRTSESTPTGASTKPAPSPTISWGRAGVPPEAKAHTRAGAEAFVRYYFDILNLAETIPDPGVLTGLGGQSCSFCQSNIEGVEGLVKADQRFASDAVEIRSLGPLAGAPANEEYFTVHYVQRPAQILSRDGKQVGTNPERDQTVYGRTAWSDGKWFFMGLQSEPSAR